MVLLLTTVFQVVKLGLLVSGDKGTLLSSSATYDSKERLPPSGVRSNYA